MTTQKILTRDFILCFLAQLTFIGVFHILIPTIPIYLSRLESTEIEIGLLIGILSVTSLIFRPLVGKALIKITEKKFMIAGGILFALSSVAYVFARPFWSFLVVRILQGIGLAFFNTASITTIAKISPGTHRGRSVSYFYLAFNISFALSPTIGMFLINRFSFTSLFFFCLGLSLCSIFLTTQLKERKIEPMADLSHQDKAFIDRKTLPPTIMTFFSHIIWGALTAFFPLYALNQGVTNPGFFFSAYAIVLILGRALGGHILDLYSREKLILPCLATYPLSMIILTFSKTLPMFILVALIWGIGNAFLIPALIAYTLERTSAPTGVALGVFTAAGDFGIGIGPVIMGIVLRFTSYPVMFLCLAITGLLNFCYFYFFVREKRYPQR